MDIAKLLSANHETVFPAVIKQGGIMRFIGLIVSLCVALFGGSLRGGDAPPEQKRQPVAEFYRNFEQIPVAKDMGGKM